MSSTSLVWRWASGACAKETCTCVDGPIVAALDERGRLFQNPSRLKRLLTASSQVRSTELLLRALRLTPAHFRLSARTAATAASGTTVTHEPITAVVVATAHRIETRCSIMPTSFDWE